MMTQEVYDRQNWSPCVRISEGKTSTSARLNTPTHTTAAAATPATPLHLALSTTAAAATPATPLHLALSTTNIVLELTRGVTFLTTLLFIFLMVGLHEELTGYTPSLAYLTVAATYWFLSENDCRLATKNYLMEHRICCLDTLEEVYLPFLQETLMLTTMTLCALWCLLIGQLQLGVAGQCVYIVI